MFISDVKCDKSMVLLDRAIGEYLETHGVPLLGFSGDGYVFSNTPLLKSKLKKLPIILKIKLKLKGGGNL